MDPELIQQLMQSGQVSPDTAAGLSGLAPGQAPMDAEKPEAPKAEGLGAGKGRNLAGTAGSVLSMTPLGKTPWGMLAGKVLGKIGGGGGATLQDALSGAVAGNGSSAGRSLLGSFLKK